MIRLDLKSSLSKFGIGIFETIKVENERPIFLEKHLNRLKVSSSDLDFEIENSFFEKLKLEVETACKERHNEALRLTISKEGYDFEFRNIQYSKKDYEVGFKLKKAETIRGNSKLFRYKTCNYMENIIEKNIALKEGFQEAIYFDFENNLLEGSMSNIFLIDNKDQIVTPSLQKPILPGIMREVVIETAKIKNYKIREDKITEKDLLKAKSVFITNSLVEIMWVSSYHKVKYQKSEMIDSLKEQVKLYE